MLVLVLLNGYDPVEDFLRLERRQPAVDAWVRSVRDPVAMRARFLGRLSQFDRGQATSVSDAVLLISGLDCFEDLRRVPSCNPALERMLEECRGPEHARRALLSWGLFSRTGSLERLEGLLAEIPLLDDRFLEATIGQQYHDQPIRDARRAGDRNLADLLRVFFRDRMRFDPGQRTWEYAPHQR